MTRRALLHQIDVQFRRTNQRLNWSLGDANQAKQSHVIRDVSVNFEPGTITSLVGPSGCGKTTLLRVLAGLQQVSKGRVDCDDQIGFVFQKPALLPWLTAFQNIRLPLEISGQTRHDSRVSDLLGQVGLADAGNLYPRQLSGGMQMRVSLARALVMRPTMLLLDEPLAALDEILREQLGELLLSLWEDQKFTAVMVTHNIAESIWLAHRVLMMDRGQIVRRLDVDLPWPRNASIQSSAEFNKLSMSIAATLRGHSSACDETSI